MKRSTVPALVTPQWRDSWNEHLWTDGLPEKAFLTFVMKASELRKLSGVFRRSPDISASRSQDDSIQRPHETGRSREIRRFVEYGYPMSSMTSSQFAAADPSIRRPGWLPTAIVVNILEEGESREGLEPLTAERAIETPNLSGRPGGEVVDLSFPSAPAGSAIRQTPPLEVIDGQHRLWAFEDDEDTEDFFLPVVAFVNLGKAHQAYLFWSINIKPKKINTSLAFDLYPILRSQEWLMEGEGLKVYRESRAQELTEALWSSPESPWYDRINMIGATGVSDTQPVTQASFVRSLMASFVKKWNPGRGDIGGLFGTDEDGGLDWNRSLQAAFLVAAWQEVVEAIRQSSSGWFMELQAHAAKDGGDADPLGRFSMLGSDQGVRVFFLVLNELSFRLRDPLKLRAWQMPPTVDAIDPKQVSEALKLFEGSEVRQFLHDLAITMSQFDWRTTKAPGVTDEEGRLKAIYRGSGGYVALRKDIYTLLADSPSILISTEAREILQSLREADDRRA